MSISGEEFLWIYFTMWPVLFLIDGLWHRFTHRKMSDGDILIHSLYIFIWPFGLPMLVVLKCWWVGLDMLGNGLIRAWRWIVG